MKSVWAILLSAAFFLLVFTVYAEEQAPGADFETALPLDLSAGYVWVNNSLVKPFEDNHYYIFRGLRSGVEVRVEGVLVGVESGLTTVSLYSNDQARLIGMDQVLGKNTRKRVELKYMLGYDPRSPEELAVYLRIGKSSGAALNYSLKIYTVEYSDAGSGRDAGGSYDTALPLSITTKDVVTRFTGYLSEKDYGNDFIDYYKLPVELARGQELLIEIKPSPELMVRASILNATDRFTLKSNRSEAKGEPLTLRIRGDWRTGLNNFYLVVENMGGTGGGGQYSVTVQIVTPTTTETTTATTISTSPWPSIDQETLRNLIIIIAIATVVIAVVVMIVMRRRAARVEEEWGGWGTESWGEESW
ncbi:MAG: hypothetical protein QW655_04865 [Nitrososphaerota archaeon]